MPEDLPSVLLVEDEDSIRLSLRDYLKLKGFTVHVASNGVGALKIILDNTIDVVVTDYRMDVFGGDYWVRFLRRFCGDMTVILTSGYLHPDFDIPFTVLFKPFDYEELSVKIRELHARRGGVAPT